mgnify:FL=1
MKVRLTEVRLRPTGKKVRLDRDIEVESLFVGRGPDNDLSLKGLTISLHQATFRMADGRLYVEAAAGQEVNVNGLVTGGERIGPGDVLKLGSWELRVLQPEEGAEVDVALEYEETDRGQSERASLEERTTLGLESGIFARRPLAWIAIGTILIGFLLVPLFWSPAQSPWNTGDVSRGHAYVESDCQKCHSGFFQAVQNDDCMTCHHDIGRHSPPEMRMAELDNADCGTCHLEHRGRQVDLADLGSGFCSDCHSDLGGKLAETSLRDASDFGEDHPPFQLALVTNPLLEAVSVDVPDDLVEISGLEFSHLRHVGKAVTGRGDSKQYLQCGACHEPDAGGLYMKPVVFEEHCQDCHRLDFDATAPSGFIPHGDPADIRAKIRGFYATRVLSGEVKDAEAPRRLRMRRPGARLSSEEAELSRRWVESKVERAERRFYERPGTCDLCHELDPGGASDGGMGVAPVQVQDIWVPGSVFSHGSHAPFACVKCHPGAAVFDPEPDSALPRPEWSMKDSIPYELILREPTTRVSNEAGDILIPDITVCRECHAGADAWGGETVPSPCSMCHPFHVRGNGPMGPSVTSGSAAATSPPERSGEPAADAEPTAEGDAPSIHEAHSDHAAMPANHLGVSRDGYVGIGRADADLPRNPHTDLFVRLN